MSCLCYCHRPIPIFVTFTWKVMVDIPSNRIWTLVKLIRNLEMISFSDCFNKWPFPAYSRATKIYFVILCVDEWRTILVTWFLILWGIKLRHLWLFWKDKNANFGRHFSLIDVNFDFYMQSMMSKIVISLIIMSIFSYSSALFLAHWPSLFYKHKSEFETIGCFDIFRHVQFRVFWFAFSFICACIIILHFISESVSHRFSKYRDKPKPGTRSWIVFKYSILYKTKNK